MNTTRRSELFMLKMRQHLDTDYRDSPQLPRVKPIVFCYLNYRCSERVIPHCPVLRVKDNKELRK